MLLSLIYALTCRFHYRIRMIVSLVVILALFLLTTALVGVSVSSCECYVKLESLPDLGVNTFPLLPGTDGFFAVTLVSVFLMNTASSMFQSSTFGFAGVLPLKYTSAVMSGQVPELSLG